MASKFVVFAAVLAYASAGFLNGPAVATYSAAPAVSSAYIHRAAPALAVAHAAPAYAVAPAAPVVQSYAASPVAIHAPAIGASQQNVFRSLGGAQSVSSYSKAVDSAFSSVRKYDTRITNDALSVAPVAAYAAPAVAHYGAPAYAAPAYAASAYAAPAYAASVPLLSKSVAPGPVVTKAAVAYSPAAVVAHMTFSGLGTNYAW